MYLEEISAFRGLITIVTNFCLSQKENENNSSMSINGRNTEGGKFVFIPDLKKMFMGQKYS